MAEKPVIEQAFAFQTDGKPISCVPYGEGHINRTYLVTDDIANQYILQKINQNVFRKPDLLMLNIAAITSWAKKTAASPRAVLELVLTERNKLWLLDTDGEYWRMYRFIRDSICLQMAGSAADFAESGIAYGRFQRQLADFPADSLYETIPRFHDTLLRCQNLKEAVQNDCCGRVKDVGPELAFAFERETYAGKLLALESAGVLKRKVTHNDTKLNNVLLDRDTRKALCVIDLDTVMPGLLVNDFGDAIRFGASTALEDERDLSRVKLSLPYFKAFTESFLSVCGDSLDSNEREYLCDGAKMMTLECGIRFLTDYLAGDTYFRISRDGQNLDRARTQFKLVAEMEKAWDEMQGIVLIH
jgi:Ser/Thr protein kinase RdoA (MazF antagonist)